MSDWTPVPLDSEMDEEIIGVLRILSFELLAALDGQDFGVARLAMSQLSSVISARGVLGPIQPTELTSPAKRFLARLDNWTGNEQAEALSRGVYLTLKSIDSLGWRGN